MRYAIARYKEQGLIVEVFQDPKRTEPDVCLIFEARNEDRKVEADGYHHTNPDYCNLEGMGVLAGIIARGIRSLEEEREELLERGKKPRIEPPDDWQDDDMGGRCGYGDD